MPPRSDFVLKAFVCALSLRPVGAIDPYDLALSSQTDLQLLSSLLSDEDSCSKENCRSCLDVPSCSWCSSTAATTNDHSGACDSTNSTCSSDRLRNQSSTCPHNTRCDTHVDGECCQDYYKTLDSGRCIAEVWCGGTHDSRACTKAQISDARADMALCSLKAAGDDGTEVGYWSCKKKGTCRSYQFCLHSAHCSACGTETVKANDDSNAAAGRQACKSKLSYTEGDCACNCPLIAGVTAAALWSILAALILCAIVVAFMWGCFKLDCCDEEAYDERRRMERDHANPEIELRVQPGNYAHSATPLDAYGNPGTTFVSLFFLSLFAFN